ncbi:MAG: hypothetical protein ACOYMG_20665 [Candidatus Methylumidiphilus sp.]
MKANPSAQERALITRQNPKRPYGAKVTFQILHSYIIGELENVTLLLKSGAIATIKPTRSLSWEGGKRYQVTLEGFRTATDAENEGLRLAQALLLSAISLNFGLQLNYHTQEPAVVFERFREGGCSVWAEGVSGFPQPIVVAEIVDACSHSVLDRTLILSMELYCAALLEPNERTRFVTVVSALEPLAKKMSLGPEVSSFVDEAILVLAKVEGIQNSIRDSLKGRLDELRQESVRQALFRLSDQWFPDRRDVRRQIEIAYGLRSKLLHEGKFLDSDIDIVGEITKISNILRAIYEQASGRSFRVPTNV